MEGGHILGLVPGSTVEAISERGTPQWQAFQWLVSDPNWRNYSEARLVQRFSLATLFFATGGENWYNNSMVGAEWISSNHECDWAHKNISSLFRDRDGGAYYAFGLNDSPCISHHKNSQSEEEGLYKYLWLPNSGLEGTIPNEVFLLSTLQVLNLDKNTLKGTISSDIGTLTNLKAVSLSSNLLTGTIPDAIKQCTNLEALLLDGTPSSDIKLSGGIPSEISQLGKLEHLWLEASGLSLPLPTELGLLSRLKTCLLKGNNFEEKIPSAIGLIKSMKDLDLSANKLTGLLPTELGGTILQLGDNSLTGSLPSQFGLLSNLQYVAAYMNNLTGSMPSELGGLEALESMSLRTNHLSGSLPTEMGNLQLPSVHGPWPSFLWLHDNSFSGPILSEIGQLSQLGELFLQGNQLIGHLPSEMGLLKRTYLMLLDGNELSGNIPIELGNVVNLEELSLSENSFTGTIPLEISSLPYLAYFNVAGNNLSGKVPVFDSVEPGSFANATDIPHRTINLTDNLFSGEVPSEMCALTEEFLLFDCSQILCGCWCNCSFVNGSNATLLL